MDSNMSFKPIEKDLLYLKIADAIYAYIQEKQLKAGDKLPSEREMAKMLQTGRNSVREALRGLENRGLIEVKTGRGTFVKTPDDAANSLSLNLGKYSVKELDEFRWLIDYQTIRGAVEWGTSKEKEECVSLAREMNDMAEKGEYSHTLDYRFHNKILSMCRNTLLLDITLFLNNRRFLRQIATNEIEETIWIPSIPFHLDMALAISRGDISAALEACRLIENCVNEVEEKYGLR